jgi:DNA-binding transcriptional MocR family regulator
MDRIDEMVTVRHAQAAERYAVLAERLAAEIPEWRWAPPSGGLSIWLRAPGMQAAAFAELAYSHGVIVVPGPVFSADGRHTDRLRLTFGDDPDRIEAGVAALARAWREWQGARA